MLICFFHYSKTVCLLSLAGKRKRLRNAVPKLFVQDAAASSERVIRASKRCHSAVLKKEQFTVQEPVIFEEDVSVVEIKSEVEPLVESTPAPEHSTPITKSLSVQTDDCSRLFSIDKFMHEPKVIKYYTSFDDYAHFQFIFHVLGPAVSKLGIDVYLSPEDQFFLTMMKLRQAKDDIELSVLFKIRPHQASVIFTTWINFMYFQFEELCIWPESDVIKSHMPTHFAKMFPQTRVILDATEVPIQKAKPYGPQRETFSSYKNKNTIKVMVGCTPRGSVSYISDAYGGSASDRQIIERSTLVSSSSPLMPGDSIMADRGIMVQDLFASRDIFVNTPTMLKGKSQLEPEEVHKDRKVASKRIHIERVIGLAKPTRF